MAAVGWRLLAVIGFAFVLVGAITALPTASGATLVGMLVSAALSPTVMRLRAGGMGRGASAGLGTPLGIAVAVVVVALLTMALVPNVDGLVAAVRDGIADLREGIDELGLPPLVLEAFDQFVATVRSLLAVDLVALAGPAVLVGTILVIGTFLTFFLLQDGDRFWAWAIGSLPAAKADRLTASAGEGLDRVSASLRRTFLLALVDAVVVWGVATIIGVGLAGPLAVLAFVGGFVPFLGAIVVAAIASLVALSFSGPGAAALMLAALVVSAAGSRWALTGTRLGRGVDPHPVIVLLAIPTAAVLFGVIGVLAVLPLTVFGMTIARAIVAALGIDPATRSTAALGGVPGWFDRLAQWSWRGLVVIGLLAVVVHVSVTLPIVVVPAVLAVVLAASIAPLATWLGGRGLGRRAAAASATAGAGVAVIGLVWVTLAWSIEPVRDIAAAVIAGADLTDLEWLEVIGENVAETVVAGAVAYLRSLAIVLLAVVLALMLTYYLLSDGTRLWRSLMRNFEAGPRARLDAQGQRAVRILGGYMVGTALISAFGAVTSALIMVLLGLPLAIPIGVLTFIGGFIPIVGSFVTTGMAVLVAVAVGTPTDVAVMMAWTIVFNLVQGNLVTPLVYGRTFSLHPAIILLAIPAGGDVAGILGMFLVVPFVAIAAATLQPLLELVGGQPPSVAPPVMAEEASPLGDGTMG